MSEIFCREVLGIWPELRRSLDRKAIDGAKAVGLPTDANEPAGLVRPGEVATLASALVRVALDKDLAEEVYAG